MRFRVLFLTLFFIVGFLAITLRLFYWQVIRGKELSEKARNQQISSRTMSASRGDIYSSDGSWLVSQRETWTLFAEPKKIISNKEMIANKIAVFTTDENGDLYKETLRLIQLLNKDLYWVSLKSRIEEDRMIKIKELNIEGVGFEKDEQRYYPEGSSAAKILGFVGKNSEGSNVGYFGLEGYYDDLLSGKEGYIARSSDVRGIPIIFGEQREVKPIKGIDLYTSLDKYVQNVIEQGLQQGIDVYGAKEGSIVVMDPKSGYIIALASYPSYDPYDYFTYSDELFINPVISQSFEPGSIFKVVVMASALDAGVVDPDTKCDICDKPYKIDKYYIKTWNNQYSPGSSMTDIIVHSDNVGMTFVGRKLGIEKFYDYLRKFGFGEKTGIDLQGEMSPKLRSKEDWKEIDLATASFGQGIAVTPIQMIRAVSAIANNGVITTPRVVVKLGGEGWEEEGLGSAKNRVISEKAALSMKQMMVEAAKSGESKWTYYKGFGVAGKTGTAQIAIEGHYDEEKTIASFVGFAPHQDPKFIMLVTLKEPSSSPWASETAAPLWYKIARKLFTYYGLQPE